MRCPKCAGRVFRERDQWGNDDTHCLACGWRRVPTYTEEQKERISAFMIQDKRIRGARRISAGKTLAGGIL